MFISCVLKLYVETAINPQQDDDERTRERIRLYSTTTLQVLCTQA